MRLNKYLSHSGVASRRECDRLIETGHVRVNGYTVFEPGERVQPGEDEIEVNGEPVEMERRVYYRYHKPVGVATTLSDPHIDRTLKPVVDEIEQRVYPVGRLDMDSRGLLLLTNDGDLSHQISHPRFGIPKTYKVRLSNSPETSTLHIMQTKGIHLDGEQTMPADIRRLDDTLLEMKLTEGRNRQIRRMFDKFNYEVVDLLRTAIGPLKLGSLNQGEMEELSREQRSNLISSVTESE